MNEIKEISEEQTQETPESSTERVEIVSGIMLVIDQFMVGNPDFLRSLPEDFKPDSNEFFDLLSEEAEQYGGFALQVSPGSYTVYRNTFDKTIVVFPEFDAGKISEERIEDVAENGEVLGSVILDTRCIAILDAALCFRENIIEAYRKLRLENDDKGARDMIRENGASVRYGFSRRSEEIEGYYDENGDVVVLRSVE
jgi:hypothetical protein